MTQILVVDDEEALRKLLRMTLEAMGYQVEEACNGAEAISILRKGAPDLVITDIVMPDKEGLETIQEIRRMHPSLKIIAMSGGGPIQCNEVLKIACRFGAARSLPKPFSRQTLEAVIRETIREDSFSVRPSRA